MRELRHDFLHERGNEDFDAFRGERRPFLVHDLDFELDCFRVVRANLRTVSVLERRDDTPAVGLILRICRSYHEDIERQLNLVTADLDVALFHDIEQSDLNALGQVRQLVQCKDAPVGARDQPI